jgi:hypothetical protein
MIAIRVVPLTDGEELVFYEEDFAEVLVSRVTSRPHVAARADGETSPLEIRPAFHARPRDRGRTHGRWVGVKRRRPAG